MEGLPEKAALNNNVKEVREEAKGISRERMGQVTRVAGAKALEWKTAWVFKGTAGTPVWLGKCGERSWR